MSGSEHSTLLNRESAGSSETTRLLIGRMSTWAATDDAMDDIFGVARSGDGHRSNV